MKKRILSLLMAVIFCLTLLPTAVFAEDGSIAESADGEGGDCLHRDNGRED